MHEDQTAFVNRWPLQIQILIQLTRNLILENLLSQFFAGSSRHFLFGIFHQFLITSKCNSVNFGRQIFATFALLSDLSLKKLSLKTNNKNYPAETKLIPRLETFDCALRTLLEISFTFIRVSQCWKRTFPSVRRDSTWERYTFGSLSYS